MCAAAAASIRFNLSDSKFMEACENSKCKFFGLFSVTLLIATRDIVYIAVYGVATRLIFLVIA